MRVNQTTSAAAVVRDRFPGQHGLVALEPSVQEFGPKQLVAQIDRRLAALVGGASADAPDTLSAAMRYALLAPGKRIRPILTLLSARELGLDPMRVLDLGCALEMVHAASLVLDDLPAMDDAAMRRGQASTHVAHGEDVAILASVALLARSFGVVTETRGIAPEIRGRAVSVLAQAVGTEGLAGGQYRDLRSHDRAADADGIADANHLKTGALFVAAVEMAAVVAEAPPARCEAMRRFAGHLGQAFQLADDLADCGEGLAANDGEDGGKPTLVSTLGQAEARHRLDLHLTRAQNEIVRTGELARFVRRLFDAHMGGAASTVASL